MELSVSRHPMFFIQRNYVGTSHVLYCEELFVFARDMFCGVELWVSVCVFYCMYIYSWVLCYMEFYVSVYVFWIVWIMCICTRCVTRFVLYENVYISISLYSMALSECLYMCFVLYGMFICNVFCIVWKMCMCTSGVFVLYDMLCIAWFVCRVWNHGNLYIMCLYPMELHLYPVFMAKNHAVCPYICIVWNHVYLYITGFVL